MITQDRSINIKPRRWRLSHASWPSCCTECGQMALDMDNSETGAWHSPLAVNKIYPQIECALQPQRNPRANSHQALSRQPAITGSKIGRRSHALLRKLALPGHSLPAERKSVHRGMQSLGSRCRFGRDFKT